MFGPDDSHLIDVKALRDSLALPSSDTEQPHADSNNSTKADIIARLTVLKNEGMQRSESVRKAAKELGVPKSIVYDIALKITWT